jgi:hypothetical protein
MMWEISNHALKLKAMDRGNFSFLKKSYCVFNLIETLNGVRSIWSILGFECRVALDVERFLAKFFFEMEVLAELLACLQGEILRLCVNNTQ